MTTKYILQGNIDSGCWEKDRVGSMENASLHLDNKGHWQGLVELSWNSGVCGRPATSRGGLEWEIAVSFCQFQLLAQQQLPTSPQAAVACVPRAVCFQLVGASVGGKGPFLRISGICAMMLIDSYLRDTNKEVDKSLLLYLLSLFQAFPIWPK